MNYKICVLDQSHSNRQANYFQYFDYAEEVDNAQYLFDLAIEDAFISDGPTDSGQTVMAGFGKNGVSKNYCGVHTLRSRREHCAFVHQLDQVSEKETMAFLRDYGIG